MGHLAHLTLWTLLHYSTIIGVHNSDLEISRLYKFFEAYYFTYLLLFGGRFSYCIRNGPCLQDLTI